MLSTLSRHLPIALLTLSALLLALPAEASRQRMAVVGVVTSLEEEPIPAARVTVVDPSSGEAVDSAESGDDGRFEIEWRGEPGTYRVRFEAEGYRALENEAEIPGGGRTELTARLVSESQAGRQEAAEAYNAAVVAAQAGNTDSALAKLDEAIAADPDLVESYIARAQILLEAGRTEEAARQAEDYLELRPEDENARRLAYEAYRRLGDEAGMARQEEFLAQTDAASSLAADVYNQGVAAYRAGDPEKALEKFAHALELDPSVQEARLATASIRFEEKRYAEAIEALDALLERDPAHLKALETRFLAYDAMESEEAEAALAAWAEHAPDAVVQKLVGWAEEDFEADRLEEAEQSLLRLLVLRPERAETHHRLGLVYASAGDPVKAKEHLRRFVELAPDHPEAASARAMIAAL